MRSRLLLYADVFSVLLDVDRRRNIHRDFLAVDKRHVGVNHADNRLQRFMAVPSRIVLSTTHVSFGFRKVGYSYHINCCFPIL